MSPENEKKIRELVGEIGDELKNKLLPLPNHPIRNPYAHVWKGIHEKFGTTYKNLSDDQIPDLVELLENIRNNPN